jgi:hypothetical protein
VGCVGGADACLRRTETSREPPGSCIVTPQSASTTSMALVVSAMMMNRVWPKHTRCQRRGDSEKVGNFKCREQAKLASCRPQVERANSMKG